MAFSKYLHVKCPFYKKWNKKKTPIFFLWNFHTVSREQIAVFYQIFKSGSSNFCFKCPQFTKVYTSQESLKSNDSVELGGKSFCTSNILRVIVIPQSLKLLSFIWSFPDKTE